MVDAGNGKFNLMILCWGPGHGSAIHDHSDSHCMMKMLSGQLSEVRYAWPKAQDPKDTEEGDIFKAATDDTDGHLNGEELMEISRSALHENEVAYINGEWKREKIRCKKTFNKLFLPQTPWAFIGSRTPATAKWPSPYIYTVHPLMPAPFSTSPPANRPSAKWPSGASTGQRFGNPKPPRTTNFKRDTT